jgi:hypothetical protein
MSSEGKGALADLELLRDFYIVSRTGKKVAADAITRFAALVEAATFIPEHLAYMHSDTHDDFVESIPLSAGQIRALSKALKAVTGG